MVLVHSLIWLWMNLKYRMDCGSLKKSLKILGLFSCEGKYDLRPSNISIVLSHAGNKESHLVFTLPNTGLYSISTKLQNVLSSSTLDCKNMKMLKNVINY